MKNSVILLLVIILGISASAQQTPDFKKMRYDDVFYREPDSTRNTYNKIKYIPLGQDSAYYASVGGDIRYQYIVTKNNKWGDESDTADGYLLSRYLFHTDIHLDRFRVFAQFQSSLANSLPDPSPVDENTADIHQLFADVNLLGRQETNLVVRVGRQEMLYGSQRLIGVREGPNSRLAFDGANVLLNKDNFKSDVFYTHPVANVPGAFNDKFNENAKLWGSYNVFNAVPFIQNIDLYYLGLWKRNSDFDGTEGRELRHSIGTRIWKNNGNWKYDFEAVFQFGKHAGTSLRAYTLSSNSSYTFQDVKLQPTLGLKTELISGDKHADDNRIQTFNPLYPRGAYFGLVALIGPSNLYDIHPSIDLALTKNLNFGIDYDMFWRWSINDGLYAPNMQLLYSGQGTNKSFIGTQLGSNIEYDPNPYLSFVLEGSWFDAGAFLKEAGTGKDYLYAAFTAQLKF